MKEYEPTKEQEQAIREYLHKSIVPLIEQVLVKKLGQAMSYAAQELVNPKREWVGLTDDEIWDCYTDQGKKFYLAIEAKLKEKNT
jgi:DNA-binding MltR family transcriptional regulator